MRSQALMLCQQGYRPILRIFGLAGLCLSLLALGACGSGDGDGIDPGLIEVPVAYIQRPIPMDDLDDDGLDEEIMLDLRDPRFFGQGGDVYLRANSAVGSDVINITSSVTGGRGDVKGLNASYDGSKLIFSLRLFDPDPDDDIVPSWNIYEYEIETATLRQVIPPAISEDGDDLFPAYLPDDRIVFTSSRQEQVEGNLINEGKPSFAAVVEDQGEDTVAMVLHVMNPDGSDIHQISSSLSHDLYPQVLTRSNAGQIIYSRWDHTVGDKGMHIYKSNPDGSNTELLYGRHSHAVGTNGADLQFTNLREMPNGDLIAIAMPYTGTFGGGDIVVIDSERFVEIDQPVWALRGLGGTGQRSATSSTVVTDGSLSLSGRFSSAFPLQDGTDRVLVSRSVCQVRENNELRPCDNDDVGDPNVEEASPAYSIWLYDLTEQTARPIVLAQRGQVITEAITVQAGLRPNVIFDKGPELNGTWRDDNVGVVNIKSVYDLGTGSFNGCFFNLCVSDLVEPGETVNVTSVEDFADPANASAKHRPARFVRFLKAVVFPQDDDPVNPDLDNAAFGLQRNLGMREIVGYAPVEPDGSVMVKVPANVPLALEVLDAGGRRIGPRHDNWFQVLPGDTLTCKGCHDPNTAGGTPPVHGRVSASAPSINGGQQVSPLPNTEIPGTGLGYFTFSSGQTLAEIRFERVGSELPPAPEPELSADMVYRDYWTAAGVARPDLNNPVGPDPSAAYIYDDPDDLADPNDPVGVPANSLNGVLPPFLNRPLRNNGCNTTTPAVKPWESTCRVAISYPRHIHPIWSAPRGEDDFIILPTNPADGDPSTPLVVMNDDGDLNNGDGIPDGTCTSCHNAIIDNVAAIPYGQLDLTDDPNQDPNDRFRAYVELLQNDNAFVLANMGANVVEDANITVPRSMTQAGARSSYFIEKMTGQELDAGRAISGTFDHSGLLEPAELKLISEWLDMGAQNFNDLFDPAAPQN